MNLSDKQWLFLQNVALLIQHAQTLGIKLTGGELYRTLYQQQEYLRVNTSKTLKSQHLKRLAIDFNFFIDNKLTYEKKQIQPLGDFWESLHENNRWGGNWKSFLDVPHFEMR